MDTRAPLLLVQPGAGLTRMTASAPTRQDELQELIATYPGGFPTFPLEKLADSQTLRKFQAVAGDFFGGRVL